MMIKQGLGISLNGRDLRIAHLSLEGPRVKIAALDQAELPSVIDNEIKEDKNVNLSPDLNEIDALDESMDTDPSEADSNIEVTAQLVHTMVKGYAAKKVKVGLNIPATGVSFTETAEANEAAPRKAGFFEKLSLRNRTFESPKKEFILPRQGRKNLKVVLDSTTPFLLSLLEQQNVYFKRRLIFSAMLPNELALLQLCRHCKRIGDDKVTIIIQVEDDFSHLIFLKGDELLWATPFFAEFEGDGLRNILYSKIIYELDHWQIDDIDKILLASKAANEETLAFFQERLPGTMVDYILTAEEGSSFFSSYTNEELSQNALPIALAWLALYQKDKTCGVANMLPQRFLDSQVVFQLTPLSGLLLIVLGLCALGSTMVVLNKQYQNKRLLDENAYYEMEIKANEPIVEQVHMLTDKISELIQVTSLADSLIEAYDQVLTFLQQANHSLADNQNVWVNEIGTTETGFKIVGQSRNRRLIPVVASSLGHSVLRHVYQEVEGEPVYSFEVDLVWPSQAVPLPVPVEGQKLQFAQSGLDEMKEDKAVISASSTYGEEPALSRSTRPDSLRQQDAFDDASLHLTARPGEYTIVLERVGDYDTAIDFVRQIQQAGYKVFVWQQNNEYLICTQTFADRLSAEQKLLRLRQQNVVSASVIQIGDDTPPLIPIIFADGSNQNAEQEQNAVVDLQNSEMSKVVDANDAPAPANEIALLNAPTVADISGALPLGPPIADTVALAAVDQADASALVNAPTVADISGALPLGPPITDEAVLAAVDPFHKEVMDSADETILPAATDSQFALAPDDYFFDKSPEVDYDDANRASSEVSAESAFVAHDKLKESLLENSSEQTMPSENDRMTQASAVDVIESRITNRMSKIFILASEHYFSDSALDDVKQLRNYNIEAIILDLRTQGKVRPFWVCLGEFESKDKAETIMSLLRKKMERNFKLKVIDAHYFIPFQKTDRPI